ncbi:hypothetical protein ID0395_08010 [Helicobacter pylori]
MGCAFFIFFEGEEWFKGQVFVIIKKTCRKMGLDFSFYYTKGKIFFTVHGFGFNSFYDLEGNDIGVPPPPRKFERGERNERNKKSQLWG